MSSTAIVLIFLFMLALVAVVIALGWNVVETQKKKKVSEMLQSVGGQAQQVETKVLMDPGKDRPSALVALVNRLNLAQKMESRLQQAGLTTSLNSLLIAMIVCAAAGAVIGSKVTILIAPMPSMAALMVVFGILPYLYVLRKRTKRLAAFEEQFPEALEFLSRAMRAGHAFSIALEMLSEESPQPLGGEFRKVFNESNLGLPIEVALTNLVERVPLIDLRFFVAAVLLQRETGGNLAEILNNLAHVIRERFKLKGQVKSASAHGRMTGTILTLMPVILTFAMMALAPTYLKGLIEDDFGKKLIVGVIILVAIGHFTIRKIVNIKV